MQEALATALIRLRQSVDLKTLQAAQAVITGQYRQASQQHALVQDPIHADSHAIAYALYRMPATVKVLKTCLSQLPSVNAIQTIIDVGAGTGAGAWACHAYAPEAAYHFVERNAFMKEVGKRLVPALTEMQWHSTLTAIPDALTADVVLASYVLSELKAKEVAAFVATLWQRTQQFLVIIDTGTPYGYQRLMKVRHQLIQQGALIVAPCGHQGACPVLNVPGDWCHFSVNVPRLPFHQEIKQGTLNWELEKYCYLIAARYPYETDGMRVIRRPRKASGMVMLDLCAEDGIKRQTITKKDKSLYKLAKKIEWGDTFKNTCNH